MKQLSETSRIWSFFQKNTNSVNCKICKRNLKSFRYTKNLKTHLERIHPGVLRTEEVHPDDPPTSSQADGPSSSTRLGAKESNCNKATRQPSRSEVLSLHAKVAAISFYDKYPEYTNVARHFPCSVKYIKEIIDSRDEILEEWNKQTSEIPINEQQVVFVGQISPAQHRKITQYEMKILNREMDVWLRGCINDPTFVATDELLEAKAIELQRLYNLKNIVPDADWISSIREKYDLKNGEDPPSDAPEADTSPSQEDNTLAADDQNTCLGNSDSGRNGRNWRRVKVELLNDSMFEWILRMQAKGNGERLSRDLILQTAQEVNKYVKVPKLKPQKKWFNKFRLIYNLTTDNLKTLYKFCGENKKHLSLEIPDIVDYVREKKNSKKCKPHTVTEKHRYRIAYTESNCGGVVEDIVPVDYRHDSSQTSQELGHISGGDVEACDECDEIVDDDVPIKCEEDLDDDIPVKCEEDFDENVRVVEDDVSVKCEVVVEDDVPVKCEEDVDEHVLIKCEEDLDDDALVKCEEDVEDDVPVKCEVDVEIVEDIVPMDGDLVDEDEVDEEEYVPRKMKRLETHDSRDNKNTIKSDEEALRYLKALENFVLLEENFRAIGVISQLEAVFRNPGNAS